MITLVDGAESTTCCCKLPTLTTVITNRPEVPPVDSKQLAEIRRSSGDNIADLYEQAQGRTFQYIECPDCSTLEDSDWFLRLHISEDR